MLVSEYLRGLSPEQFHIFDSHQEGMDDLGKEHKDQDYIVYSYNIHHNNKPKAGDAFLYRRPGKSSKTRKFYIYGGGIIKEITNPDREGNVFAIIEKPFKLDEALVQDSSKRLDEFEWTSKEKKPGSWGHFWNQYGMNVIDEHDFYGLVGDLECTKPDNHNGKPASLIESVEEEELIANKPEISGFTVSVSDTGKKSSNTRERKIVKGTHIDYDALQRAKSNIGMAGELLVVELLREQYSGTDTVVEHTSMIKGDGFGYDITVFEADGSEIRIEVKTTKSTYVDGFYITPKELNAARQCEIQSTPKKSYKLYRVYNLDIESKTASIKIFDGPFSDENFRFVPTAWKVYER